MRDDLPVQVPFTRDRHVTYEAGFNPEYGRFGSWIKLEGTSNDQAYPRAQLNLYCEVDEPNSQFTSVAFAYRQSDTSRSNIRLRPERTGPGRYMFVTFGGGEQDTGPSYGYQPRVGDGTPGSRGGVVTYQGKSLWYDLQGHAVMKISFVSPDRARLVLTFDIRNLSDVPIRDNLDYCGEY